MAEEDPMLARLLSGRDEPSVLEAEAIFEEVMQQVAPKPRRGALWAWSASVAGAAALLLWFARSPSAPDEAEFRARGGAPNAVFSLSCGAAQACRTGMSVRLEIEPPPGRPYLALVAQRPDGAAVWYYPKHGQAMPSVRAQRAGTPWSEAMLVTADAPSGTYRWFALFAAQPLGRDELKRAFGDQLQGGPDVTVVERKLVLETAP